MAKNRGNLPDVIFVSPIGNNKNKIRHRHVAFRVVEFTEDGRPLNLRLIDDDETVNVQNPDGTPRAFMTGYVQEHSLGSWDSQQKREK